MPTLRGRRSVLAGAGLAVGAFALGGAVGTSPAMAHEALALPDSFRMPKATTSVALWGSSSMQGGLGAEHTPRPVYVHEELGNSFSPVPVYNVAYGAQISTHTMILRGLDTVAVTFPDGYPGGEKVQVSVNTSAAPLWSFTCHGTLSSGGSGTLEGSSDNSAWWFTPDPGVSVESGDFLSSWKEKTANSRHVVWTGKNNISDVERVIADVERMVRSARNGLDDVIVMGQWVTLNDLASPTIRDAMKTVNDSQRSNYGSHFLDVQAILTDPVWLDSEPLWDLDLMHQPATLKELGEGIVPDPLRGSDGVHLSGWGNLLVSWALIEKMKELGWM